jgi:uncharacterized protein
MNLARAGDTFCPNVMVWTGMKGFVITSWEAIRAGIENPGLILPSWSEQTPGLNSSLMALLLIPVLVGLASSLTHCAGMCAPIHFYLASKQGKGVYAYHAGRVTTYAGLGLIAGSLGSALFQSEPLGPWARVTATLLALMYGLMALHWFGVLPVGQWIEKTVGKIMARPAARIMPHFRSGGKAGSLALFGAGMAGGLLPCPTTQAMLLFSVGLSHVWSGAIAMAVMGLGTMPLFLALRPKWAGGPRRHARVFASILGLIFVALAVQKVHGAWFAAAPTCH